jgi:hypothetical protein
MTGLIIRVVVDVLSVAMTRTSVTTSMKKIWIWKRRMMNNKLEKKLTTAYPGIFEELARPSSGGSWNIGCGDGWFDLLDTLCLNIQNYFGYTMDDELELVVTDIRAERGGMRFFVEGGDDYIMGLIHMAETMSARMCEECGERGEIDMEGCTTLCEVCTELQEEAPESLISRVKEIRKFNRARR